MDDNRVIKPEPEEVLDHRMVKSKIRLRFNFSSVGKGKIWMKPRGRPMRHSGKGFPTLRAICFKGGWCYNGCSSNLRVGRVWRRRGSKGVGKTMRSEMFFVKNGILRSFRLQLKGIEMC